VSGCDKTEKRISKALSKASLRKFFIEGRGKLVEANELTEKQSLQ
jgi:hypothetical protein